MYNKNQPPALNPAKIPENRYKEQFGVIVICKSEKHQKQVYDALRKKGYNIKVVVT